LAGKLTAVPSPTLKDSGFDFLPNIMDMRAGEAVFRYVHTISSIETSNYACIYTAFGYDSGVYG
jgi:hypothetical protein